MEENGSIDRQIAVIGAGVMGSAIIKGLVGSGMILPQDLTAIDIDPIKLETLAGEAGINTTGDITNGIADRSIIILAVKPQTANIVLEAVSASISKTQLVLSIIAGLSLSKLSSGLAGHRCIIRCMPNTPALIGKGITAIASLPEVSLMEIDLAERLLKAVGDVVRVGESCMDAVTGLSGSGPAYVYTFIEALIDAGVREGLSRDLARRLALATVSGSTDMVSKSGLHPATLRDMVTSPGGTTIAAIEKLEREGFRAAIYSAVAAAAERSAELEK